jgi:predicted RecB family nuclease
MAHRLNASTIKSWFQYRCERKVRYETSTPEELEAVPVTRDLRQQAWAQLGIDYEKRVVDRLARQAPMLRPAPGDTALSERLAIAFLRGARPEGYAAQVNLQPKTPPPALAAANVSLTRTFPDLMRREIIEGQAEFTIIDIKATRAAAIFHKTQVAYYVRILEALLRELSVAARINPVGEIWRLPDDGDASGDEHQVETFALAPYLRLVDEFLAETLPDILSKRLGRGVDETFFHVYFKCEQCAYLPHCSAAVSPERPPNRRDVSAAPGLSHEGKKSLQRMHIYTVADLARARGLAQTHNLSWSLKRRAETLVARANALATTRMARTSEEHTFLMPPRVDVAFLVSVDHDPVDDRLAAIGYRRLEEGRIAHERIEVLRTGRAQEEIDAIAAVLGNLLQDLARIDAANAAGQGLHSHIFFYEPAEAINLQRALGRHLDDPRIRTGLLDLIRLFPPDDVVPEPEFRGVHHLPATAIRSVLEQLYALPVTVSYDLRQTSRAIAEARGRTQPYDPGAHFARPFSSLLSIDVIRAIKEGRDNVTLADIEADIGARLSALQEILAFLFDEHAAAVRNGHALLRLAKRPFRFQASFDPLNAPDLDILTALELLENRSGLLESLVRLAQPASRRLETAQCMGHLTLRKSWSRFGQTYFRFAVPPESRMSDLGSSNFDLILTDDTPDLRLDPTRWPLMRCRIEPPSGAFQNGEGGTVVSMLRADAEGALMQGLLQRTGDRGWFVDRSFRDVNTTRAVAFFRDLANVAVAP